MILQKSIQNRRSSVYACCCCFIISVHVECCDRRSFIAIWVYVIACVSIPSDICARYANILKAFARQCCVVLGALTKYTRDIRGTNQCMCAKTKHGVNTVFYLLSWLPLVFQLNAATQPRAHTRKHTQHRPMHAKNIAARTFKTQTYDSVLFVPMMC